MFKILAILLAVLAVVGMPLFAVLGGISILSWLSSDDPSQQFVRFIAANVLEEKFSGSIILVTIPLFTFVGYLMAESRAPDRMVRAASAALGWLPGGLAIVCILASAFFTTLTGGSGVTIVAIGGLLYPMLVKQGYPKKFALGLVTTAGAMGLLFPPSPLVLIYGFVSGVDIKRAYTATLFPGLFLIVVVSLYAAWVGKRSKVPTEPFVLRQVAITMWEAKWELFAPVLVLGGLGTGLMALDESAAAAALYTVIVEVYVYKDLTWKQVIKVAREAMSLAGAIILILAMATALTNYVIQAGIPNDILQWFVAKGMNKTWHFIIVLNIFLFILGMLMDAFSALLVALPLLVPLAATFGLHPFYLAVMFLLNLEIAYVTPPVGLNLYISSFRFRRPVVEIYRVVLPFVALLSFGLVVVILYPPLSDFTVKDEVATLKTEAENRGQIPRDAWALECVQEDRNHPKPCTAEDIAKWGPEGRKKQPGADVEGDAGAPPEDDESLEDMMAEFDEDDEDDEGEGGAAADEDAPEGQPPATATPDDGDP